MPRKREIVAYESSDDLIEAAFKKGARKVLPEFEGQLAVAVVTIAVVPRGAKLDGAITQGIIDGHYVELSGASRADIEAALGDCVKVSVKRANKAFDVIEELALQLPA
ncbi:MAG: hypothetical protein M0R22_00550 [Dehalococcoidia bacterium]|jgi:hypothetical protein|nr:hypothetical protein [Dehalococcoidia bacterium]